MASTGIHCPVAWLPEGWATAVDLRFDDMGHIVAVEPGVEQSALPHAPGPVIPGMPNLHSHAFQRAMAGLTSQAGEGPDSFWSWRKVMYGFVERLQPEAVAAIAAQLYLDGLKHGYTAVGEFHYLHHKPSGRRYTPPALMAHHLVAAARQVGIGMTLLPVLYMTSGFGAASHDHGQRRFVSRVGEVFDMLEDLRQAYGGDPQFRLGLAPHSLRAVPPAHLAEALALLDAFDPTAPLHLHIAEQVREVEACLAWCGARPVAWLLDHWPVSPRWCLIHATHMTAAEAEALARTGAVVGLCPTTEADLGDGIFPAETYLRAGGAFGIGSDSHVCVSPAEELRLLEYGQRLTTQRRNVLVTSGQASVGAGLYRQALAGGRQALGRSIGRIHPGARADLVVLDCEHPLLWGKTGDTVIDTFVFSGGRDMVRDVYVGGRQVIADGRHAAQERVAAAYRKAIRDLV